MNKDIRPWISIGEAASLVLARMVIQQEAAYASWKPVASPQRNLPSPRIALRNLAEKVAK